MYGSFDSQTYSCMVLNLNDEDKVNKKMLLMLTSLLFFYFLILMSWQKHFQCGMI